MRLWDWNNRTPPPHFLLHLNVEGNCTPQRAQSHRQQLVRTLDPAIMFCREQHVIIPKSSKGIFGKRAHWPLGYICKSQNLALKVLCVTVIAVILSACLPLHLFLLMLDLQSGETQKWWEINAPSSKRRHFIDPFAFARKKIACVLQN